MQEMDPINISTMSGPEELFDKLYIGINTILHERNVHDRKYFEKQKILGQEVNIACIKSSQDYLKRLREKCIPLLAQGNIQRFIMLLKSVRDGHITEKWYFDVNDQPTDAEFIIKYVLLNSQYAKPYPDKVVFDVEVQLNGGQLDDSWARV